MNSSQCCSQVRESSIITSIWEGNQPEPVEFGGPGGLPSLAPGTASASWRTGGGTGTGWRASLLMPEAATIVATAPATAP